MVLLPLCVTGVLQRFVVPWNRLVVSFFFVFSVCACVFLDVCAHESTVIGVYVRWRCITDSLLNIIPSPCKTAWEHLIVKQLIYTWQLCIPTQWICMCVTEKRTSWLWGRNSPVTALSVTDYTCCVSSMPSILQISFSTLERVQLVFVIV